MSRVLTFCLLLSFSVVYPALLRAELPDNLPDFAVWLGELRDEAIDAGVKAETVDAAFKDVKPDMSVIARDRNQPEFKQTFHDYVTKRVSPLRIKMGIEKLGKVRATIDEVAKAYGVQARFIAAIWGLETNYGNYTGGKEIIPALTTLAYDPRRSSYFRKELINALKILDNGDIELHQMTGSWAGAMGQPQFMPSSYLAYAQDYDGDGHRNIWTSDADVFASIAHYLKKHGWTNNYTWGRQVTLPPEFDRILSDNNIQPPAKSCALRNHAGYRSLAKWNRLGVRRLNGNDLPDVDIKASIVRPDGPNGPAFLAYGNYRSILRYNCSDYYALSVGMLSDKLR